ncbi:WRKY transcription factor 57 [Sarracenia purpurea var. burkii]
MDDEKDRVDPGVTELAAESSWTFDGDSDSFCFFGSVRESSILSEFGWNLRTEEAVAAGSGGEAGSFAEFYRIGVEEEEEEEERLNLAGNDQRLLPESTRTTHSGGEPAVRACPVIDASASSSSSEDPPENSTASGGSGGNKPRLDAA